MQDMNQLPNGEQDHEGAMAKADLYKLANYSLKLFKKMDDSAQLESWVQAKITKAADYIASVYHYMEYEMKFSEFGAKLENSEMYSESQKAELKNKLMEAKSAIKELKKQQAEKLAANEKPKKSKDDLDEGILSGGDRPCEACGGTGTIHEEPKQVPSHVKSKVAAYNKKAKAMSAAVKRVDANKNGIPDALEDDDVEEGFDEKSKVGDTFKTKTGVATKTSTGVQHTNTSFNDEEHGEPPSKVKQKSAAEKKADKAKEIKLPKHKGNTWGMKGGEKFGNGAKPAKKEKEVDETFGQGVYAEGKAKPDFLDMDKDGNKKETFKKAVKDKKVKEGLKGGQKKLDVDHDGDIEADDLADLRAKKKSKDVVKEAIARAQAGTSESFLPEVTPVIETSAVQAEVIQESTDLDRVKQFLTRLNG